MYRIYILITDINPQMFEDFIAFVSSVYNTNVWDEESGISLASTNSYDIYAAYLFELGANETQFSMLFRWFSERRGLRTNPLALVAVRAEDDIMIHTINISDVHPGTPYYWDRFVESVVKRFNLEQ